MNIMKRLLDSRVLIIASAIINELSAAKLDKNQHLRGWNDCNCCKSSTSYRHELNYPQIIMLPTTKVKLFQLRQLTEQTTSR